MAALTALTAVSVTGTMGSRNLVTAGDTVSNMAMLARQRAISKSTMTAVVVLTKNTASDNTVACRTLALMEYTVDGWVQVSKWETLPAGIVMDPTVSVSTFLTTSTSSSGETEDWSSLPVVYRGNSMKASSYAYQCFLPSGGLLNPDQSASLRLVEGTVGDSGITYRRKGSDGNPSNYYDIAFLGMTGVQKINRK